MITNVNIRHLTGVGISLHANHDTTLISNSLVTNTSGNAIFVSGQYSVLKLINNTFRHNSNPTHEVALFFSSVNFYGFFNMDGNVFQSNNVDEIMKFSIPNDAKFIAEIVNNDLVNNTCENIVEMEYYYSCDSHTTFVLKKNHCSKNHMRGASVMLRQVSLWSNCYGYKTDFTLTENDFLNNTGMSSVEIVLRRPTRVTVHSNLFQGNVLEKSAIVISLLSSASHENKLSLFHNKLENNVAKTLVDINIQRPLCVIHGNSIRRNEVAENILKLSTGEPNREKSFNFSRNTLIANTAQRHPLPYPSGNSPAGIISYAREISLRGNFFENPQFGFEFMVEKTSFVQSEIDAKYNWWGSKNESEIIWRIFDFHWRHYLARVNFFPLLASANLSDVRDGTRVNHDFRKDHVIWGSLTEYIVLEKDDSPYTVIRDVIIHPNATLVIKAGVHINIFPDVEFHVYGKFELLGEQNDPIIFDIKTKNRTVNGLAIYPVRLVNGSTHWEGLVEIFYNNTWGTICDEGYWRSSTGSVLCKQLGYKGYHESYTHKLAYSRTKPVWLRNLRCNSDDHDDISSCSFQGWGISCPSYRRLWAVRCNPGYWRGIRFRETAQASRISHVKFKRGGGDIYNDGRRNYVLHFDVLRQAVSDIEIREISEGGIKIGFQGPGVFMKNIQIENLGWHQYNSYGIEISSSLTCKNCSVSGVYHGISFRDFERADSEIHQVDSTIVPQLELRKEFLMCEPNNSVIVGKDDLKYVTMSKSSYSDKDVECLLPLVLQSQVTVIFTEKTIRDTEAFSIISSNVKSSTNTTFTANMPDKYDLGPGNFTLRYWRRARSYGSTIRLIIISSGGKTALQVGRYLMLKIKRKGRLQLF